MKLLYYIVLYCISGQLSSTTGDDGEKKRGIDLSMVVCCCFSKIFSPVEVYISFALASGSQYPHLIWFGGLVFAIFN